MHFWTAKAIDPLLGKITQFCLEEKVEQHQRVSQMKNITSQDLMQWLNLSPESISPSNLFHLLRFHSFSPKIGMCSSNCWRRSAIQLPIAGGRLSIPRSSVRSDFPRLCKHGEKLKTFLQNSRRAGEKVCLSARTVLSVPATEKVGDTPNMISLLARLPRFHHLSGSHLPILVAKRSENGKLTKIPTVTTNPEALGLSSKRCRRGSADLDRPAPFRAKADLKTPQFSRPFQPIWEWNCGGFSWKLWWNRPKWIENLWQFHQFGSSSRFLHRVGRRLPAGRYHYN